MRFDFLKILRKHLALKSFRHGIFKLMILEFDFKKCSFNPDHIKRSISLEHSKSPFVLLLVITPNMICLEILSKQANLCEIF